MGAAGSEDSPRIRSIADLSSGMYIGPSPLIGPDFRKKNPVQTETGAQLDRIITFRDEVADKSPGAIGFDPGNCRVHDFALAGGYGRLDIRRIGKIAENVALEIDHELAQVVRTLVHAGSSPDPGAQRGNPRHLAGRLLDGSPAQAVAVFQFLP